MNTLSETRLHIVLALQAAGEAPMAARVDNLAFYFQGWHLATLGCPVHSGSLQARPEGITWSEPSGSASPRDRTCFHAHDKLRPLPLPQDSERLLQAVLAYYATVTPYQLHLTVMREPVLSEGTVTIPAIAAAFSEKELPDSFVRAGFTKQPYRPAPPEVVPLTEDQRFSLASKRIADIPGASGEGRFREAVDVGLLLIGEYMLVIQGGRIFREFCARCSPPISRHEGDQCWRAAKRYLSAIQHGPSPLAEAQKYHYIPGGAELLPPAAGGQ